MRRTAFFGGSFDPPHRGHLAIARAAADRYSLDEVLFAPVGRQPLKAGEASSSFFDRYAMTALATQCDPRFVASLLDAPQGAGGQDAPNYTVDTLTRLRASLANGQAPFALFALVGADSWLDIARWHRVPELLALCDWIVAARPGFPLERAANAVPSPVSATQVEGGLALAHSGGGATRVWFLADIQEDISATEVRSAGNMPGASGIGAVEDYVRKARLYRTDVRAGGDTAG